MVDATDWVRVSNPGIKEMLGNDNTIFEKT